MQAACSRAALEALACRATPHAELLSRSRARLPHALRPAASRPSAWHSPCCVLHTLCLGAFSWRHTRAHVCPCAAAAGPGEHGIPPLPLPMHPPSLSLCRGVCQLEPRQHQRRHQQHPRRHHRRPGLQQEQHRWVRAPAWRRTCALCVCVCVCVCARARTRVFGLL